MSWADGSPRVRVRRDDAKTSELVPLVGLRLNYSVGPDAARRCVGHKPFRASNAEWVDCDNAPLHESRKCDRCAAVDATFASQLHHAHNKARGELDPAVLGHLDQPNKLYLATFRDGSIKVGTSTEHRLPERLTEQGAWRARSVAATADGLAVRIIEDRVSAEIGLPQSVSIKRKLDGLVRPAVDDRLGRELDRWTNPVHELVAELADDRIEPESVDWVSPLAKDSRWMDLHRYPLKLSSGAHDLEFVGASGRAVMVTPPASSDKFVADMGQLYGIVLELGEHSPDELAVQDRLF